MHDAPTKHARLMVAMPALNESATIGDVIDRIPDTITGVSRITVLVVDDGSDDDTADISRSRGATVISHTSRRGVGAAFQTALRHAISEGADILATLDSDGQFNPEDLPELIAPVVAGEADFTSASRFKDPGKVPEMPPVKLWGNRQMSRLISGLTGQKFFDVSCGMRSYNRAAMLSLNLVGRFTYTQEVFLNLAFKQMRIAEVPLVVRGEREFGKSRVAGSIWKYATNTSRIIWRAYRDYQPLRFFGVLASFLLVPAGAFGVLLLMHYLEKGRLGAYTWVPSVLVAMSALGVLFLFAGLFGDMLVRHRIYLEELLYHARQRDGAARGGASSEASEDAA